MECVWLSPLRLRSARTKTCALIRMSGLLGGKQVSLSLSGTPSKSSSEEEGIVASGMTTSRPEPPDIETWLLFSISKNCILVSFFFSELSSANSLVRLGPAVHLTRFHFLRSAVSALT